MIGIHIGKFDGKYMRPNWECKINTR